MKAICIIILTVLSTASSQSLLYAQDKFPVMEGITLNDKKLNLPQDIAGKPALLGIAYSKKSDDDLRSWMEPIYSEFISEKRSIFSVDEKHDIHVLFIPMFTGVAQVAAGKAENEMKKNFEPKLFPNILLYKGSMKPYRESLNFGKDDVPHFFLLDAEGRILYRTSGAFTDEKMEKIMEQLNN